MPVEHIVTVFRGCTASGRNRTAFFSSALYRGLWHRFQPAIPQVAVPARLGSTRRVDTPSPARGEVPSQSRTSLRWLGARIRRQLGPEKIKSLLGLENWPSRYKRNFKSLFFVCSSTCQIS